MTANGGMTGWRARHALMTEFELITHYFKKPANNRHDVILGIGDDAALLQPPRNQLLVVTTDTLIEGVHFLPDASPHTLGHKSLAVSLSDLAAMGAEPAWIMLSLSLPHIDESWLSAFSEGFFSLSKKYNLQLVGGNTTRGQLSISTHLTGFAPPGKALQRDGAKPGDLIYVTGFLGDAALALACLQKKMTLSEDELSRIRPRLETPTPRVSAGLALRDIATAAIDISDGLVADLGHILQQSFMGATLNVFDLPLSQTLKNLNQEMAFRLALSGGDDYELCFTIDPTKASIVEDIFSRLDITCQKIGVIEAEGGLRLNGAEDFVLEGGGYDHFCFE
jgi:thiamine-monophosphate kinase